MAAVATTETKSLFPSSAAPAGGGKMGAGTVKYLSGIVAVLRSSMYISTSFQEKAEIIMRLAPMFIKAELSLKVGQKPRCENILGELRELLWHADVVLQRHRDGQKTTDEFFVQTLTKDSERPCSFFTALLRDKHIDLTKSVHRFALFKTEAEDLTNFSRVTHSVWENAETQRADVPKLDREDLAKIAERIQAARGRLDALSKKTPEETVRPLATLVIETLSINKKLSSVAPELYDSWMSSLLDGMVATHVAVTSWMCLGRPETLEKYIQARAGNTGWACMQAVAWLFSCCRQKQKRD